MNEAGSGSSPIFRRRTGSSSSTFGRRRQASKSTGFRPRHRSCGGVVLKSGTHDRENSSHVSITRSLFEAFSTAVLHGPTIWWMEFPRSGYGRSSFHPQQARYHHETRQSPEQKMMIPTTGFGNRIRRRRRSPSTHPNRRRFRSATPTSPHAASSVTASRTCSPHARRLARPCALWLRTTILLSCASQCFDRQVPDSSRIAESSSSLRIAPADCRSARFRSTQLGSLQ